MTRQHPRSARRRAVLAASAAALGAVLFAAGAVGLAPARGGAPGGAGAAVPGAPAAPAAGADPVAVETGVLQARLRQSPDDASALGRLGLDYVQLAKSTADPSYYPRAEGVLTRSLALDGAENFTAMAGMAALAAGRHEFAGALDWSRRAIAVNPDNATLYGIQADALTQLGRYPEAFDTIQRMVDLRPGTPSLTRASYSWELRGEVETARQQMARSLDDASTPADRAFALYHLSQLAFDNGDPRTALTRAQQGLRVLPGSAELLEGRAKAEAALGDPGAAVADYTRAVALVPQPGYVLELGELLQSLGRQEEAQQQYQVFRAEEKLLADNGVAMDSDATLFEADHGDPRQALATAEQGLRTRPFLDMHDARAWALHVNGRDDEALAESVRANALGMRNALFAYHQGVIEKSLGRTAAARADLARALEINPAFSVRHAPDARAALRELGAGT
ncbi:tetratricopeptide repeat protein [Kitasatospora sp. NBC_01287]|uniref:tetratricopeptide repeat protein n=1 Tax=Kitasatospora sp. NBC_01287 TaxID=2903573 RepID=UPI00224D2199|nr:tetratricopeptide repeat protein [Kitasatospora sp. NBC_01287]MCX4751641.1 tetratricopeptide repeat protein [Kitasatospora sp. NBC_01287]